MDVKTLCLGVLTMGDASGYEIKKALEECFSRFYDASYGSIYPALAHLQEEGLVSCAEMPQDGKPDKKVYALTPAGRERLLADLLSPPAPDRIRSQFMVSMFFSEFLPRARVRALIDERLAHYDEAIATLESHQDKSMAPSRRFVLGYGLALYRTHREYLAKHRHLVEAHSGEAAGVGAAE